MKPFIFILLKIIEISAVIFVPYGLGAIWEKIWPCGDKCVGFWIQGAVAIVLIVLLVGLVKVNWELAGELKKKIKGQLNQTGGSV